MYHTNAFHGYIHARKKTYLNERNLRSTSGRSDHAPMVLWPNFWKYDFIDIIRQCANLNILNFDIENKLTIATE